MVTLKCETTFLPPLAPDEYMRRLDGFIDDYGTVVRHVLVERYSWYPPWSNPTMAALVACTERREFPPFDVVARVVGWVLFNLNWEAERRVLTDDENQLQAAAHRLGDCFHGPRDLH